MKTLVRTCTLGPMVSFLWRAALTGCSYWSLEIFSLHTRGWLPVCCPCFSEVLWSMCKFPGCEFPAQWWDLPLPASESCPTPAYWSLLQSEDDSDVRCSGSHGRDALIIIVSSSTWKLGRNVNSIALSQTDWVRNPRVRSRHLCFQKPSRWFPFMLKFWKYWIREYGLFHEYLTFRLCILLPHTIRNQKKDSFFPKDLFLFFVCMSVYLHV